MRLKNVLKVAAKYEIIPKNPFDDEISLAVDYNGKRNYLTDEELQKLINMPVYEKAKGEEKDRFCFSVFTGLSSIDVQQFTRAQLYLLDGRWWIRAHRKKTDVLSVIPLLPQAETILRKYCPNFEKASPSTRIFPFAQVEVKNIILKQIV